jgi:hypothetical protein
VTPLRVLARPTVHVVGVAFALRFGLTVVAQLQMGRGESA